MLLAPTVTALVNLLHYCECEIRNLDMQINFKKSSCVRIRPRHDVSCASVVSLSGQMIPWVKEVRYLGSHIVSSRTFRCSLSMAKRSFSKPRMPYLVRLEGEHATYIWRQCTGIHFIELSNRIEKSIRQQGSNLI